MLWFWLYGVCLTKVRCRISYIGQMLDILHRSDAGYLTQVRCWISYTGQMLDILHRSNAGYLTQVRCWISY